MKKTHCVRGHDIAVVGRYDGPKGPGTARCKQCTKDDAAIRSVQLRGTGQRRDTMRPQTKLDRRAYEKEWRAANPTRVAVYQKRYRRKPESQQASLEQTRRWRSENREHTNQVTAARRLKTPPMSKNLVEAILDYYGGSVCVYCGGKASGFDHLYPLSKGGLHVPLNLAPCCKSCNSRKNNLPIWTMLEGVAKGGIVSS